MCRLSASLALLLLGCSGEIEDARRPAPDRDPSDPSVLDTDGDGVPDLFAPAPGALRRLTRAQYLNTVRDLLSQSVELTAELPPDNAVNGFVSVGASTDTISPRGVEQYEAAAFEVAGQAAHGMDRQSLSPCVPEGQNDADCLEQFVRDFGHRAFRRPLSTEEVDRYAAIAVDAALTLEDFWAGIEFAIAGLLQSPHFLFRAEFGEPDPDGSNRLRYSSSAMATRLAYFLWNTTPDDTLLEAAARGELTDLDGLRTQAERLAGSPRVRDAVRTLFTEWLDLVDVEQLAKNPSMFEAATPSLPAAMREGVLLTLEELLLTEGADYRSLFDAPTTFVNAELATLYGLPVEQETGFWRTTFSAGNPRLGLLGQGAVLARHSHPTRSSPTLRGKFVRQVFLCQEIPAPPPDVGELPEPLPGALTMRERLTAHRENEACATCHALMDPVGLGLENFDGIGAFRTEENGATIDPSGELDGVDFADAAGLGRALRDHARLGPCFVRNVYRFATGHVELAGEEVPLRDLIRDFEADPRLESLLVTLTLTDGFRYAGEPQ